MKKAFISIYVLLILLVFGLTISFVYKENETNFSTSEALYNKKIALYEAESFLNILLGEKSLGSSINDRDLLTYFDHKSEIEIGRGNSETEINEAKDAKTITVKAKYNECVSWAVLTYKIDENNKVQIIYKRVY